MPPKRNGRPLKIGVVTSFNPANKHNWSGTPHYMVKALRAFNSELTIVGPFKPRVAVLGKIVNGLTKSILGKKYDYQRSIWLSKVYSGLTRKQLEGKDIDLIFGISCAPYLAFYYPDKPLIFTADATFSVMAEYYEGFSNLLDTCVKHSHSIADSIIQRADLLLYPSAWAARSAVRDYGASEEKVHIVPLGANLDDDDIPERDLILSKKRGKKCRLLFIGVDWKRKGGEIAFDTLRCLNESGVETHLTICGCIPPAGFSHDKMQVIPFLDKNDPVQRQKLNNLFLNSDFLFVPTRSEAYGLVFCEGNAFGLPAISTDTGGVSGIVRNGENGFLLPYEANGTDYAQVIAEIWNNDTRFHSLVRSSRLAFEQRLNWQVWGAKVNDLLIQLLRQSDGY